jgi:hypothetical protein
MSLSPFRLLLLVSAVALLVPAGLAGAQEVAQIDDARDEVELKADIRNAIERDIDVANTALVFNNASRRATVVHCTAYSANGEALGKKIARVPALGVRYIRASDLSGGADFVGSALCKARGSVVGSAVFLAPGSITNLDILRKKRKKTTWMRFPLVATY